MTKPSTSPASTSHGIVPKTSSIAGRASRRSDSPRVSVPGSTSAHPIRSPAVAATAMQESSSTPWGRMSRSSSPLEPFSIVSPRIAPMKPPLKIVTAAVPSPAKIPPAMARNVTRMLLVKICDDSAASSPPLSVPAPPLPGSAAPWNCAGTTPIAAAGSSIAHTAASANGPNSIRSAAPSSHGRSRTRCQ